MLNKEEIILLFLEDPKKLADEIRKGNILKSDEIRTLICELGDPRCAYRYAINVDTKPTDEIRAACCKDPTEAYYYARLIDNSPHPDTRQAACKDPWCAYWYAYHVDKSPHPDTRQAVQNNSHWKEEYEEWEKECLLKKT